jgi:carbamoyl-phosphate synthase large subunit
LKNIYVSSVGGDIAQSIIGVISETFESISIFGTDVFDNQPGCFLVNHFEVSPHADDSSFFRWLTQFLRNNRIDCYIPTNESELRALASISNNQLNRVLGSCSIIWAGRSAVSLFGDKFLTSKFLTEIGVNAPQVYEDLSEIHDSDFPLIVKPRFGSGSKGIFKCNSKRELEGSLQFVPNPIIQKFIGDDEHEFTAGVFRNSSGESRVIIFRRKLIGGATGWAEVYLDTEMENVCKNIASAVNLSGSINIQFRLDQGEPSVFEINGRLSSTVYMRHLLGFEDVNWSFGLTESFSPFNSKQHVGKVLYRINQFRISAP